MKLSTAAIFAVAIYAVSAQLALPDCVLECVAADFDGTSCPYSDGKCICSDKRFITSITGCIYNSCNAADQERTANAAVTLCKGVGVDIPQSLIDSLIAGPTMQPTSAATVKPTSAAIVKPTSTTTVEPTSTTTVEPTSTPTVEPTSAAVVKPTSTTISAAIVKPTSTTTVEPTSTAIIEPTPTTTVSANVRFPTVASATGAVEGSPTTGRTVVANAAPTLLGASGMMGAVGAAVAMFLL